MDRAQGEEMSETLSLSIFTIEAGRKPLLAFAAKNRGLLRKREGANQTQIGQIRRRPALQRRFDSARSAGNFRGESALP
jgi:hypothetical protein